MRIPNAVHENGPWRIREIARDFKLEDVWQLPVTGDAADFDAFVALMTSFDPANGDSIPARALWRLRERLGACFHLGSISQSAGTPTMRIPGTREVSLKSRLPGDLAGTASDVRFAHLPFHPLYRTKNEFAAEISNATVHGIMHVAWVPVAANRYEAQMAVYVRPRGAFGHAYMALIAPFRHAIVYPALMAQVERAWARATPHSAMG